LLQTLKKFYFISIKLADHLRCAAPGAGTGTGRVEYDAVKCIIMKQQGIARNVVKYLKPGKPLIYITCSVFKAENEEIVDFMVKELGLKLEKQAVLKGYGEKADTMFVARLTPWPPTP